jgi:hypothetical protein
MKFTSYFIEQAFNRASQPEHGNSGRRKDPPPLCRTSVFVKISPDNSARQASLGSGKRRLGWRFRPENDKPVYPLVFSECVEDLRGVDCG